MTKLVKPPRLNDGTRAPAAVRNRAKRARQRNRANGTLHEPDRIVDEIGAVLKRKRRKIGRRKS